jgi:predicted dehydrogenase
MQPLTHAGGYRAAGVELVALVDVGDGLEAEAARWDCKPYRDFDAMMRAERPDILSLCTTAAARPELLQAALAYRPRAVIAEKPLTPDSAQAQAVKAAYNAANVPLIVNYTRRFTPAWQALAGTSAMTMTIRYAKGVRHNGSHAIDLCRMLFGECLEARALSRKTDFWDDDPTISAFLRFERCPEVFLQALDERCFTLFEADIVTAESRIVVDQDGRRLRRWHVEEDVGFPPGRRLVEGAAEETGAQCAMINLIRHACTVADGEKPLCGVDDAIAAQKVAEALSV